MTHVLLARGAVCAGTDVVADVVMVAGAVGAMDAEDVVGYTTGDTVCLSIGIGSIVGVSIKRSVSAKVPKIPKWCWYPQYFLSNLLNLSICLALILLCL